MARHRYAQHQQTIKINSVPGRKKNLLLSKVLLLVLVAIVTVLIYFLATNQLDLLFTPFTLPHISQIPSPVPSPKASPDLLRTSPISTVELKRLHIKYAENLVVLRPPEDNLFAKTVEYKGIPVKISKSIPQNQINLINISSAIISAPVALLDNAPWTIYLVSTTDIAPAAQFETGLALPAFAGGPNIYLGMKIDQQGNIYKNNDQKMFSYSLYHSWIHIIQYYKIYNELTETAQTAASESNLYQLLLQTPFVRNFAYEVGWNQVDSDWKLAFTLDAPTDLAKTSPLEDQAEIAALYLTKQTEKLSPSRLKWAEEFFGADIKKQN